MSLKIRQISISNLKNVGKQRASILIDNGFSSIYDLLYFLPYKHIDRSTNLSIEAIKQYLRRGYEGELTIVAKAEKKEILRVYGGKSYLKVFFSDSTGAIECIWFNSVKIFDKIFIEGKYYALSGRPVITKYGNLQMAHPDFDKIEDNDNEAFLNTGKIIPFYSLPNEMRKNKLGDFSFRALIKEAIDKYLEYIEDPFDENFLHKNNLISLKDAIKNIHFPENYDCLKKSKFRLKFDEIFFYHLAINFRKSHFREKNKAPILTVKTSLIKNFVNSLPFKLTADQLKTLNEIKEDLASSKPMNRLLQGDVGSGKTIVALIASLFAVDNGYQAAVLAPTEILAMQHYKNFEKYLSNFNVEVILAIGGSKTKNKINIIESIRSKSPLIVVGTHALLEEFIEFKNLGLAIIDEQHRFGVEQRAKLAKKGLSPHTLLMTATPIPRTLTMTLYGDVDVSKISQMPAGRKGVKTVLRGERSLPKIYKYIVEKAKEGIQSYVVYPLVEESDKLELKAAVSYYENLKENDLSQVKVGLLHGKMKWNEKEDIMKKFAAKEFDVLIATTVIEVGIDIPDANIMLINDAHRFGLSQLHQLRGRVGRGDKQGLCILVSKDEYITANDNNLFELDDEYLLRIEKRKNIIRLKAMLKYNDGFKLSEIDMRLRGPGNILGIEQSGLPKFKLVDLTIDEDVISLSKKIVEEIIAEDPLLTKERYYPLKSILIELYKDKIELSSVA